MRLALIVPGFSAHAAEWAIPVLQNLVVALANQHEVHIFSLRYPPRPETNTSLSFGNLTHHPTGGGQRFGLASFSIWAQTLRAIQRQHRQTPFDLFHAFWADEAGLVAGLAGKWLRRPVVVSSAGGEFIYLPDIAYGTAGSHFRRFIVRQSLQLADAVTVGSRYQEDLYLVQRGPVGKVHRLPLGVDTGRFPPQPLPAGPLTLLQAASLTPVKNQELLLALFNEVKQRVPEARLIVAGDGPQRTTLQEQARQARLWEGITWLGEVDYPQMPAVHAQAHLYVQTSRHESQGMAVLEAMATGRAVVGTPVGVARELAQIPETMDPAGFADVIAHLWQHQDSLQHLAEEAIARVGTDYALPRVVERFNVLYHHLRI